MVHFFSHVVVTDVVVVVVISLFSILTVFILLLFSIPPNDVYVLPHAEINTTKSLDLMSDVVY